MDQITVEQALYRFMAGNAVLTAIFGSGNACRIFPDKLPQRYDYPAMVYEMLSGARVTAKATAVNLCDGLFQLTVISETVESAIACRQAILAAFDATLCVARHVNWGGDVDRATEETNKLTGRITRYYRRFDETSGLYETFFDLSLSFKEY